MKVLLDTGVLGLVTHPKASVGGACTTWMRSLIAHGAQVVIPEICDYELRRKYLHIRSQKALQRLDELGDSIDIEKVDSGIWRRAAEVWAECRRRGNKLASDDALDGDVILIALTERAQSSVQTVVATTNVKHLAGYIDAKNWDQVAVPF